MAGVLVDAGTAAPRRQITEAPASFSAYPVKELINSHWHLNHTDANEWLNSERAAITGHHNNRQRFSVATRMEAWKFTFPPAPARALPTTVFKSKRRMCRQGE
jgi:glyoxylase-like metal-dependent hydrolase (beta-lactamase superfamily II)